MATNIDPQQQAAQAVFVKSTIDTQSRENAVKVRGPTLQSSATDAVDSLTSVGYQATNFGKAVSVCKELVAGRRVGSTIQTQLDEFERELSYAGKISEEDLTIAVSAKKKELPPVVFLGIISTLFGTGVRDAVTFLCEHSLVDVIVVSGGGLEHDIRRAVAGKDGYFTLPVDNAQLGHSTTTINTNPSAKTTVPDSFGRFGNVVYDKHNERFTTIMTAIVRQIAAELAAKKDAQLSAGGDLFKTRDIRGERGVLDGLCPSWCISPREFWQRVGELLPSFLEKHEYEQTVTYWAAKNNIPLFCPSITDGDIMRYVFPEQEEAPAFSLAPEAGPSPTGSTPGASIARLPARFSTGPTRPTPLIQFDLVKDIYSVNRVAMQAGHTGIIVLGGGVVKHHICNANLFRNGAEHAVYISNAQEYDGSDGGARPDEAVSWGKIKATAKPVKIYSEISLVFPLLVAASFAEHVFAAKNHQQ